MTESPQKISWKHESRKVSELKEWDKNPRKLTDKGIAKLKDSLSKFGVAEPIVINQDNVICGGHGRLKALKQLGIKEVPVYVAELTDKEFEELNIRLNKNIAGEWDFDILANEFEQQELLEWGFEPEEFGIAETLNEGLTDEDAVPEAPPEPITKLGDVWLLGNHRLMCGDSTSIDAVEKLMAGAKADMVFTDPPYGMSYGGGRAQGNHARNKWGGVLIKAHGEIIGDDKRGDELVQLVRDSLASAKLSTKEGAAYYVCFPWRTYTEFEKGLEDNEIEINACIVWNKRSIGLGNANYRPQHEFIFYSKGGVWFGDKAQSDVWEMSRGATSEYVHPTQKPVELIEKALNNSSKSGDSILDLFGGSGSTLIACEKTNRHARLMELDPKYCDVIIKRWQEFTGKEAILEGTDKTYNSLT